MAGESSHESTIWTDRASSERHWRNLFDIALFDGNYCMVAVRLSRDIVTAIDDLSLGARQIAAGNFASAYP